MPYRSLAACVALLGIAVFACAEEEGEKKEGRKMGLGERRALKEYQEKILPKQVENINAAAGFEVPMDIQWETIAVPGQQDNYLKEEFWTNIFFVPLTNAFKDITKDEEGKKVLKENLKKVVIRFDEDTAPVSTYENGVKFEDGVLDINFRPFVNADDIKLRAEAIVNVMEPKL